MNEEKYVQGVDRMRLVASERKAIEAVYKDDKEVAHKLHKEVCSAEKSELKPWNAEYETLAVDLGEALQELRNSPDGEPICEGVTLNTNYDFKVLDESKIPKLFYKLDESKIKKAIKINAVPGVETIVQHKLSVKAEV